MDYAILVERVKEAEKKVQNRTGDGLVDLGQQILSDIDTNADNLNDEQREELRCRSIVILGRSFANTGDDAAALVHYESALAVAEQNEFRLLQAHILNLKANSVRHLGEFDLAEECYEKSLSIFSELESQADVGSVHIGLAAVAHMKNQIAKSVYHNLQSIAILEKLGNKHALQVSYGNLGLTFVELNDNEKALQYLEAALALSEELNNKYHASSWLAHIANLYSNMSDHANALSYMAKALRYAEDEQDKNLIASHMFNMAAVYGNFEENEAALELYEKALALFARTGRREAFGPGYLNMGTSLTSLGKYNAALEHFRIAEQHLQQVNQERALIELYHELANFYLITDSGYYDIQRAEENLRKSIALSEKYGKKNFRVHQSLSKFLKSQGRWEESLAEHEIYHELKEQSLSEKVQINATLLDQRLQLAAYEKEIAVARSVADTRLEVTTSLLNKVLPASIAQRKLNGEDDIADYFPSVSILFADIEGFTPMSAQLPAVIVVRLLNHVFRHFDRIIQRHGCEKIKTIGDGYMAVAGAPQSCEDHAERIAAAALEMQQTITLPEDIRQHLAPGTRFGLRIGLHTGSVIAGLIGEERYVYDIYSDAVNTAARMERHGDVNRIHVSNEFYQHLQNRQLSKNLKDLALQFERRGEIEVKGKGTIRTFFMSAA